MKAPDISAKSLRNIFKFGSACIGGPYPPDDYILIDLETSGLRCWTDVIVELSVLEVINREPKCCSTYVLRRDPSKLTKEAVAVHGISAEIMEKEGVEPCNVFHDLQALLRKARQKGIMFGGHNFVAFDAKFLEAEFRRFGAENKSLQPFKFLQNELIDTGMIIKCARIAMEPRKGDTLKQFFDMVSSQHARGVYFNLDRYCAKRFNLAERGLDGTGAHRADYDVKATHIVLEQLRSMAHDGDSDFCHRPRS